MNCPFCKLDILDISNTIIEESNNFLILPSKGSFVDGYLLILPKKHLNSINELQNQYKEELINLITKYREKFFQIYKRYPIIFEHGSSNNNASTSSSSVTHAHIHIVNHNFLNEKQIIKDVNFQSVNQNNFFENKDQNYISYISPNFDFYISYNFKPISQQMRIFIAKDLNILDHYNWKISNFDENILTTINNFKIQNLYKKTN